jgi:hypothetical protein
MKLSRNLNLSAVVAGSLLTAFVAIGNANAAGDPTQGRIEKRQTAQDLAQYHECAAFSLRVYQAGLTQAGNDSEKIRRNRRHYHANLDRCRARFL